MASAFRCGGLALRLLIAGGAGFVGAHLARHFAQRGPVHVLVRSPPDAHFRQPLLHHPNIRWWVADLNDRPAVQTVMRHLKPDAVINAAVYGSNPVQSDEGRMRQTNLQSVANLLWQAQEVQCKAFIQTGSCFEYPACEGPIGEEVPPAPSTAYAQTKLAGTQMALQEAHNGLPACVLRLFTPFGPYDHPRRLIPSVMAAACANQSPALSRPWPVRDFVHIGDVCRAYERTLDGLLQGRLGGEIINIGSGQQHSNEQTAAQIMDLASCRQPIRWSGQAARLFDPAAFRADISKAARLLGWAPACRFRQGLESTYSWFCQNKGLYPRPAEAGA